MNTSELFTSVPFGHIATIAFPPREFWGLKGDEYTAAVKAHENTVSEMEATAREAVRGRVIEHSDVPGGYDGDYWTCHYALAFIETATGPRVVRIHTHTTDYSGRLEKKASSLHLPIDATPEVRAAADAYLAEVEAREERVATFERCHKNAGAVPVKTGCLVIVTKGRKVPISTVGIAAGVFDGNYGPQVRLTLVDADGRTDPRDKARTWYVPVGNVSVLMGTADAQPDYRAPMRPEAVRAIPTAFCALAWATRNAMPCVKVEDKYGVVWECPDCSRGLPCALRDERALDGWREVSERLQRDPLAALVAAACEDNPPCIEFGMPHSFTSVMEALECCREDLCRDLQEFPAAPTDATMRETMFAAARGRIMANLGMVYEAPAPAKRKRAPKKAKAEGAVAA